MSRLTISVSALLAVTAGQYAAAFTAPTNHVPAQIHKHTTRTTTELYIGDFFNFN